MILTVPDELLVKIFSHLTTQDLLLSLALVNKKFNQISMDANSLKVIALKDIDEYVFEDTKKALDNATMIKEFCKMS